MASNDNKSTTFKKYDRNRFRKIYPVNRQPASNSFRSNESVVMESLSIPFYANAGEHGVEGVTRGSISATGALKEVYTKIPTVMVSTKIPPAAEFNAMAAAEQTMIRDTMNVSLFISTITLNADGKVEFTIEASDWFAGDAAVTILGLG